MTQKIVIAGTGFAGVWAALSASRAIALAGRQQDVEVIVVSPAPALVIRPRLYEAVLDNMNPDVGALLAAVGARHLAGRVETIDVNSRTVTVARSDGERETIAYDRFVLAAGSQLFRPDVPGLDRHAFDTDQFATAHALDVQLKALPGEPETEARNTVVVAGGGLTGFEAATEMPIRLRAALGDKANFRVILIDTADRPGGSPRRIAGGRGAAPSRRSAGLHRRRNADGRAGHRDRGGRRGPLLRRTDRDQYRRVDRGHARQSAGGADPRRT